MSDELKSNDGWIRVEDRLPENNKKVIVYVDRYNYYPNYLDVAFRQSDTWNAHQGNYQRISHWMPMPPEPGK